MRTIRGSSVCAGHTSRIPLRWKAATCCCWLPVWWLSGWVNARRRRARRRWRAALFDDDLAHTVLAVPIAQERAQMHLDTVCTMVDVDAMVMYPGSADSLSAFVITRASGAVKIHDEAPFVQAAARCDGYRPARVIDTGLDPITAEREQWDGRNNTLALAPGVVVAYERNVGNQCAAEGFGNRSAADRRIRARHRARRSALSVVPGGQGIHCDSPNPSRCVSRICTRSPSSPYARFTPGL